MPGKNQITDILGIRAITVKILWMMELFRDLSACGRYKYDSTAVSSGHVNGDYKAFEALVGYKKNFDSFVLLSYIGAEFEEHDLSPKNIADRNRGNHWGGKARVDLETNFSSQNYGNLIATYGTARDRYWVRARGGRDFSGYVVGPEIIATGDREAHEERIGAFLNFRNFLPAYLSVSAGQAKSPKTSAGYTPYITMEYSTTF